MTWEAKPGDQITVTTAGPVPDSTVTVVGKALHHSIEDPFTGVITVDIALWELDPESLRLYRGGDRG